MTYIIVKRGILEGGTARSIDAYTGKTCEQARVKPGKIYTTFNEAVADAERLIRCNGAVFALYELGESIPLMKWFDGKPMKD